MSPSGFRTSEARSLEEIIRRKVRIGISATPLPQISVLVPCSSIACANCKDQGEYFVAADGSFATQMATTFFMESGTSLLVY